MSSLPLPLSLSLSLFVSMSLCLRISLSLRGFAKGWFPKGWFWRMFPFTKTKDECTFRCSPARRTGKRAHSLKPPFCETALTFPLDLCVSFSLSLSLSLSFSLRVLRSSLAFDRTAKSSVSPCSSFPYFFLWFNLSIAFFFCLFGLSIFFLLSCLYIQTSIVCVCAKWRIFRLVCVFLCFSCQMACRNGEHPGDHNHQDFPKVLRYKWEAYCNTDGRRIAIQMG